MTLRCYYTNVINIIYLTALRDKFNMMKLERAPTANTLFHGGSRSQTILHAIHIGFIELPSKLRIYSNLSSKCITESIEAAILFTRQFINYACRYWNA